MVSSSLPVLMCQNSTKSNPKANIYGYDTEKDFGVPFQEIFQSGFASHPFRFTNIENPL